MNLIIEMSILIAAPVLVVWALIAWYKHQGASGMAKSTGKGLGLLATVTGAALVLFGKAIVEFVRLGKTADIESAEDNDNQLMGPFILDADDYGVGPSKDSKGNIYL